MIKRYKNKRIKRIVRVRGKIRGTADRPRLTVFRSLRFIYAQLIDDARGVTLAAAKGKQPEAVGAELGEKAGAKKIKAAVFDRGPYQYHGRLQRLADAARKAGLRF
jgi:large subunit ribosomal protein L18